MRNIVLYLSESIPRVSEYTVQAHRSFYLLAGLFGLFLMSAQVSQLITEGLLRPYNTKPSIQQSFTSIPSATSKIKSQAIAPPVPNSAGSQKDEVGVSTTTHEIVVGAFEPVAKREKEPGKVTGAIHEIDALTARKLASHVKTTYKVSDAMAKEIVTAAISLSRKNGMDPLLTLGIIASESSFNHKAKSGYGAIGLMQVYSPVHRDLLEELGVRSKNPKIVQKILSEQIHLNVAAGIRIYKTYEKQYGSQAKALQAYNGAKLDASYSYAQKVLAVREQLRRVAAPVQFGS